MITTKEDALVEAMVRAVVAPSDTESDQATEVSTRDIKEYDDRRSSKSVSNRRSELSR
jgi:hypothetical protein